MRMRIEPTLASRVLHAMSGLGFAQPRRNHRLRHGNPRANGTRTRERDLSGVRGVERAIELYLRLK